MGLKLSQLVDLVIFSAIMTMMMMVKRLMMTTAVSRQFLLTKVLWNYKGIATKFFGLDPNPHTPPTPCRTMLKNALLVRIGFPYHWMCLWRLPHSNKFGRLVTKMSAKEFLHLCQKEAKFLLFLSNFWCQHIVKEHSSIQFNQIQFTWRENRNRHLMTPCSLY